MLATSRPSVGQRGLQRAIHTVALVDCVSLVYHYAVFPLVGAALGGAGMPHTCRGAWASSGAAEAAAPHTAQG
jgi:hypothetical protein